MSLPVNSNLLNKKCGEVISSNCVEYKVYYLRDPRNNTIRYVGFTGQELEVRLKEHITIDARYYKGNWIKELQREALIPIIELVGVYKTREQAAEKEIYYIGFWGRADKKKGLLTNLTDGGDGGRKGGVMSEDARKKLSIARKGKKRSAATIEKIRISKKDKLAGSNNPFYGKRHSEETRKKIKEARSKQVIKTGWKMTDEQKKQIGDKNRGRVKTFEELEKIKIATSTLQRDTQGKFLKKSKDVTTN